MEELIQKVLDEYFSDFKEYHLIILIGFTLVITLIQIIQSIIVTRKIEKFKNDLKKSEIKFSRYNELQINALRKIYHQLAVFQYSNNLLFNAKPWTIGHEKYKTRINNWIKAYIENANEFSKEKILLTPELKLLYTRTINDFEEVKKKLIDERENLDYWEMMHGGDWNAMYDFEENELGEIESKIKKLRELESIKNSNQHIQELRENIEELFLKMN
ncbi:hypothetical protein [uncultured Draconibacterium sp.]|uniref:hypothetical protein n=1 Tax=uncultured Draconibacterium sp. TaxID=1573823 RepID=UPI002AA642BF|nr:hypothetical protein [uncultured Draconibacterium sp.]